MTDLYTDINCIDTTKEYLCIDLYKDTIKRFLPPIEKTQFPVIEKRSYIGYTTEENYLSATYR